MLVKEIDRENLRFFRIGLRIYVFPPDPEFGDFEALKNWKPIKMSLIDSIKLIWKYKIEEGIFI